jgi:hypothetical protein
MLRPGELGLCSAKITTINSIITWSASTSIGKREFLEEAETLLNNNPDNLGYYWDLTKPKLCEIIPGRAAQPIYNPFFW